MHFVDLVLWTGSTYIALTHTLTIFSSVVIWYVQELMESIFETYYTSICIGKLAKVNNYIR
jgi:hypothetical protein